MSGDDSAAPYHPERDGCECERQGRGEFDECVFRDPCWISRGHYERYEAARQAERDEADRLREAGLCPDCRKPVETHEMYPFKRCPVVVFLWPRWPFSWLRRAPEAGTKISCGHIL